MTTKGQPAPRRIEYVPIDSIQEAPRNPKQHHADAIARSIARFGFADAPILDERTGRLVAGHGRLTDIRERRDAGKEPPEGIVVTSDGTWTMPVQRGWASRSDEDAEGFLVAHNHATELGGWDHPDLAQLLTDLQATDGDLLAATGYSIEDLDALTATSDEIDVGDPGDAAGDPPPPLADKYLMAPFSVLARRDGRWQERRRQWVDMGIESREGRPSNLVYGTSGGDDYMSEVTKKHAGYSDGTSTFDPVLAELSYLWFSLPGDRILDPFAGGSVRGIVASHTGRHYLGIDIRQEQIDANVAQAERVCRDTAPEWRLGDATDLAATVTQDDAPFDMILTCPPYADLEVYSDDPADLSTMRWPDFVAAQDTAIRGAVALLADDRFIVWVTSDVRAPSGEYRGLAHETIKSFHDAGCQLYNDLVLVDPIGTGALRAERPFQTTRKVTRTHQVVLVFAKGSGNNAGRRVGSGGIGAD